MAPRDAKNGTEVQQDNDAGESTFKIVAKDIIDSATLISRAVSERETRFASRGLRKLNSLRTRLTPDAILLATNQLLPEGNEDRNNVETLLEAPKEMDTSEDQNSPDKALVKDGHHEVGMYLRLLVALYFLRENNLEQMKTVCDQLVNAANDSDRREASPLFSRIFYFYSRAYELLGQSWDTKSHLHKSLRVHTLRQNASAQAVLINSLLRLYLNMDLIDQAELLVSKVTFPETAPNTETARYLYYLGRIKAVQLEYSEADHCLLQASRKAPRSAIGFNQHVHKLHVIVKMLLGEIPEREIFRDPHLQKPLLPYFKLTQAVRQGEVGTFARVVSEHSSKFQEDKTYKLILRLRQSVIKAGVKTVSLGYSRISLIDLAAKLGIDSPIDAEYIVAKAIKDGVIDATINHRAGYVTSKEVVDIYSTNEPQEAFHKRISFCLKLHDDSVKAMRYPPNAYKKYLRDSQVLDGDDEVVEIEEI
eukprot:gene5672-7245_t